MWDISWSELLVVGVVGAAVTGRKDLPKACRMVGSQVGRIVGLLQGARARADQFAAQNELKQLQNELRSGLRELDQVRTELAVAASSQGMMGRSLGATTASANRAAAATSTAPQPSVAAPAAAAALASSAYPSTPPPMDTLSPPPEALTPASHSETAALEMEWEKQGIGYQTQSEQRQQAMTKSTGNASGSELLEQLIRNNLTWDQYDRVVGEQDAQLQSRIDAIRDKSK